MSTLVFRSSRHSSSGDAHRLRLESLEPRVLLSATPADLYEPNDDFAAAADLGQISGTQPVEGLTIHDWGDQDYFIFTTTGPGAASDHVGLEITGGFAHMGLGLYDSDQNYLDGRDGWPTLELPLEGVAAGTYYLQVAGYEGTDVFYDLTFVAPSAAEGDPYEQNDSFSTATDLGGISDVAHLPLPTIHDAEDVDYFHFTTLEEGTAAHYVETQFTHADGDLDMALYDGDQNYLRSSKTLTDDERISLEGLPAGDYYAYVYGYLGATNEYDLLVVCTEGGLMPDAREENDSFATATDFGKIGGWRQEQELTIHSAFDVDYFSFTTLQDAVQGHYIEAGFDVASGDLDLELYDGTEHLLRSAASGTDDERLSLAGLPEGKYYVRVAGYAGATNEYDLLLVVPQRDWSGDDYEYNDSYNYASNLGGLEGTTHISDLTIDDSDDLDYFKFSTAGTAAPCHYAEIQFTHGEGNLDMELYDEDEVHVLGWATTPTDNERISFAGLPAGTYYLLVYGRAGATNGYDLTIEAPREGWDADGEELNNDFETATDLTQVRGLVSLPELTIHNGEDEDYFVFATITATTSSHWVGIEFNHAEGDLDLELYDGSQNHLLSATSVSDDERISLEGLDAGTYFVRVYGYSNAVNGYDLTIKAPFPTLDPDDYEPNDDLEGAVDLREVAGTETVSDLTIHDGEDLDYFAFSIVEDPTPSHYVEIQFAHAEGDLYLALYDADGTYLTGAISLTDNERISLAGFNPGDYVAKVGGVEGQTNRYDLLVVGPEPILPDLYEENDSFPDATNLGAVQAVQHIPNLTRHDGEDDDYFRFVTSGEETTSHYVEIRFSDADGDLELALYNELWEVLDTSTSGDDNERIPLGGLPAGTYYVKVYGRSYVRNAYELVLAMPAGIAPDGWENTEPLQLRGNETLEGLTIHDPAAWNGYGSATDVFEFTTAARPGPAHYIQIDFAHADGDINMRLLDPMGRLVREGWSSTDNETIELDGLPSGAYSLEIYGVGGAVNTYDLTINVPFFSAPLPQWTLLFYMDGDDISGSYMNPWSCETHSIWKINDMESVSLPYDVQVGVLFDRISGFSTTSPDWTDTRVGVLRHDSDPDVMATQFDAWEPSERNVGESYTLRDYLNWASVALPAQHYGLFLFDHGGGYYGVCWDETSGDDQLTLGELHEALDQAAISVDVIGFDACLMQMTEVAYALSDVVDVVVASEEVEHVPGWYMGDVLSRVAQDPFCSPQQLGSHIVESFANCWGNESTLSAIDTSTFPLYNSLRTFAHNALELGGSSDWQAIAEARNATPSYHLPVFRDLGGFLAQVFARVSQPTIRWSAFSAFRDLQDMVLANHSGPEEAGTGLSIYLPNPGSWAGVDSVYRTIDFGHDTGWLDFAEELISVGGAVATAQPDWAESNDARASAYDLHTLVGDGWVFPHLSMHNIGTPNGPFQSNDWFQFTTLTAGEAGDEVRIDFDNDEGNLDLVVYNSNNIAIGIAHTSQDQESVSLENWGPDTFHVLVTGRDEEENPDYTLSIDAPPALVIPIDWAVGNISQQKATALDLTSGAPQSGLYVGAGEEDWFSIPTSMLAWQTALTVTATYPVAQYDLLLEICDGQGNVLAASQETSEGAVVSFAGAESGNWFLKVTTPSPADFVPYTLTIDENVGPDITLQDPPAGAMAGIGDVVTVSWHVFDPDDDAGVALYWDADSDPDNNDPAAEGAGWGAIAAGLSGLTTSFDWTVDVPGSGQYYLCGVAEDASLSDTDYTATTFGVRSLSLIASEQVDGALISIYDTDPSNGVSAPGIAWNLSEYRRGETDILVHPGRIGDGVIDLIALYGDGSRTEDLGFVVEGNMPLQRFADMRVEPSPVSFLVSEGYVGRVDLKAGLSGANLNGFATLGGWDLPADLDGDGLVDDRTGLYTRDGLRLLNSRGDVRGDIVAGADVGRINVLGAGLAGDVVVTGSDIGHVLAVARFDRSARQWTGGDITGDITAAGSIGRVIAVMGDISGDIYAGRDVRVVKAVGGDIAGAVDVGGDLTMLLAVTRKGRGGAITGAVDVEGGLRVLKAIGGDLGPGPIEVGGDLATLLVVHGDLTGDLNVQDDLRVVKVIGGDLRGDIGAGGHLGALLVLARRGAGGDVRGSLSAGAGLRSLKAAGDMTSPAVNVAGRLHRVAIGGGVAGTRFEVTDTAARPGAWGVFSVAGGVEDSVLHASGRLGVVSIRGDLYNTGIDAGSLGLLLVRGRIWEDGSDGDQDEIRARSGRFYAADRSWRGLIDDGVRFGDHWFDEVDPDGLRAWVG